MAEFVSTLFAPITTGGGEAEIQLVVVRLVWDWSRNGGSLVAQISRTAAGGMRSIVSVGGGGVREHNVVARAAGVTDLKQLAAVVKNKSSP